MEEIITIDDEVHMNKKNGKLEKWNIGRMCFLKNHLSIMIPLFQHSITPAS